LITYAASKAKLYQGSISSQTLVKARSRALITKKTEITNSSVIFTSKPMISIEIKTYPKEKELNIIV